MKKTENALAPSAPNVTTASLTDIVRGSGDGQAWSAVIDIGTKLAKSGFLGQGVSCEGGMMAAMTMMQEGLTPVDFKRRYHIIQNSPTRTTNSLLGDFITIVGGTYDIERLDDDACVIVFKRNGFKDVRTEVTMERMLKTKVPYCKDGATIKDNWANFPDDMLFNRAVAKGLRRIAPELMGGVYTREEAMDFTEQQESKPEPKVLTPEEVKVRTSPIAEPVHAELVEAEVVEDDAPESEPAEPEVLSADDVFPIAGPWCGKPWSEVDADIIAFALNPAVVAKHGLTDCQVAKAKAALQAKQDAAKEVDNA